MAFSATSFLSIPYEDLGGYWIKFYEQGTTTPLSMATDITGATLLAKAELSSGGVVPIGFINTVGSAIFIPYVDGDYDAWLFPTEAEADANDTTNAVQIADNIVTGADSSLNPATVSIMTSDGRFTVNDVGKSVPVTKEFFTGSGGGGTYDIVLTSSVTPNGFNIIIGASDPLISFVLRAESLVDLRQFGAVPSVSANGDLLNTFLEFGHDNEITCISDAAAYIFDFTSAVKTSIPCAVWIGSNTSIKIVAYNSTSFEIGEGFYWDGLDIFTEDASVTKRLLFSPGFTENFRIGRISFKYEGADQTGATRILGFARVAARNILIDYVEFKGVQLGIVTNSGLVANGGLGVVDTIRVNTMVCSNYQTGFFCNGDVDIINDPEPDNWTKEIHFGKIFGTNTETQYGNFTTIPGADIVLVEGYQTFRCDYIKSERAIERAIYVNTGIGPCTIGDYDLIFSSGIKVAGYIDDTKSVEIIAKNITIGKGTAH